MQSESSPHDTLGAVTALLDAVDAELARYDRPDLAERLQGQRELLTRPTCQVMVIGEFNKGKSSLVNALLNARVCATDADVATAVPTVVRYADQLCASYRATEESPLVAMSPSEVESLVTRRAAEREAGTERVGRPTATMIEVGLPRSLLRHGLVLVDTPGMGGGLNSAHAAATLRALARADAVLFVTDAGQELSAAEVDLLRRASGLCQVVAIAVTKIDFYPEWRRIVELDLGHLQRAGLQMPVYPLSAPVRHRAVRDGDRAQSAESGYPVLAAFLRWAVERVRHLGVAGVAAAAHGAVTQVVSQAATAHDALARPEARSERMAELAAAKDAAQQLGAATSRWQLTLNDLVADMASAVDFDITTRMRGIRRDAADKLATTDPQGWLELEPWLYQHVNSQLAEHLRMIHSLSDQVADQVAHRFGATAWEVRVRADSTQMGLRQTVADTQSGLGAAATTRRPNTELLLGMARGGSVAVVASHAVGIVFSLAVPVTIPIAAVIAGVLGRVTYRSTKSAQVRQLQVEAERAVVTYLDEVEVRARRDSRDAVRHVQQYLREVFGQHAAELQRCTARNLEVLAESIKLDAQASREDLARSAAELKRLQALASRAEALADQLSTSSEGAR